MSPETKNMLPTILKGAGIGLTGLIIGNMIALSNQVLLARCLGPNDYGILNLGISVTSIIGTFCSFGLVGALPTCIPRYHEKKKDKIVRDIIIFSIKFVFFTCIFMGLVMWIFSNRISSQIFHENDLEYSLKILSLVFPLLILPNISQSILRGFQDTKYKALLYDIGMPLVKIIIFSPFIFVGNKLFGAMVAYTGGLIFVFFASIYIIQKKYFPFLYRSSEKIIIGKKLLLFSWPLALTGVTFLTISKTDIILLGHYMSSTDLGIYSATLNIAGLLLFIGKSFEWIFLPTISKCFITGKFEDLESLFKSSSKWMFLVVMPLLLFVILFSKEIIILFFGKEYIRGSMSLVIVTCGLSTNVLTGLTGSMLVGNKHTKLNLLTEVIGGITNICLDISLIPLYGLEGAAIGSCFSYTTRNLSSLIFVYKTSKIHPFKKNHITIIFTTTCMLLMLFYIKNYISSFLNMWEYTILLGTVLFCIYLLLIVHSGILDANDKFILAEIRKKIKNLVNLQLV